MKLRITVEGVAYDVDVEVLDEGGAPAAPAPARPAPAAGNPSPAAAPARPASAPPAVGGEKAVKAPIAGTIHKISVKVGDQLNRNDVVLVMEAMKMETNISSPSAGRVKAIKVSQGQAVKAGDVLVEFE